MRTRKATALNLCLPCDIRAIFFRLQNKASFCRREASQRTTARSFGLRAFLCRLATSLNSRVISFTICTPEGLQERPSAKSSSPSPRQCERLGAHSQKSVKCERAVHTGLKNNRSVKAIDRNTGKGIRTLTRLQVPFR